MQVNDQGKLVIGLAIAVLGLLATWAGREVTHYSRESSLTSSLKEQTAATVKTETERRDAQDQLLRVTNVKQTLEKQLAKSEDSSKSVFKKWNADGSGELHVDSSVSKRLELTEARVTELNNQLQTQKSVTALTQSSLDERTREVTDLQQKVATLNKDVTKQGRRIALLADVDMMAPGQHPRAEALGFLGSFTAGFSLEPMDLAAQKRAQVGWVF